MSNNDGKNIVDLRSHTCPFAGGVAQSPQGQLASILPPCAKEKCAVWDPVLNMCSVLSLTQNTDSIRELLGTISIELLNLRQALEPPKDGPSPLMRLADAAETIGKQLEGKRKG